MPCSGLKSATSCDVLRAVRSGRWSWRRRVRGPVWLVTRPTRLPRSGAKPSARSTSMPVSTGSARRGHRRALPAGAERQRPARDGALAATRHVAQAPPPRAWPRARAAASRRPCRRGAPGSRGTRRRSPVRGSIHRSTSRSNPVWPKDPAAATRRGSTSRRSRCPTPARGRCASRPASTAWSCAPRSAARGRARPRAPRRPSSMRAKRDRSAAVVNRPAWPATPPMRRAVGSCTMPRSIAWSGPSHGHPSACTAPWGRSAPQGRGGQEHRVAHAERLEHPAPARNWSKRLSGHPRDDVAEQEEVDVAVDEPLVGRRQRDFLQRASDRRVVARATSSLRSRSGRSPEVCVSRWRIVMLALAVALEAGHVGAPRGR